MSFQQVVRALGCQPGGLCIHEWAEWEMLTDAWQEGNGDCKITIRQKADPTIVETVKLDEISPLVSEWHDIKSGIPTNRVIAFKQKSGIFEGIYLKDGTAIALGEWISMAHVRQWAEINYLLWVDMKALNQFGD